MSCFEDVVGAMMTNVVDHLGTVVAYLDHVVACWGHVRLRPYDMVANGSVRVYLEHVENGRAILGLFRPCSG